MWLFYYGQGVWVYANTATSKQCFKVLYEERLVREVNGFPLTIITPHFHLTSQNNQKTTTTLFSLKTSTQANILNTSIPIINMSGSNACKAQNPAQDPAQNESNSTVVETVPLTHSPDPIDPNTDTDKNLPSSENPDTSEPYVTCVGCGRILEPPGTLQEKCYAVKKTFPVPPKR